MTGQDPKVPSFVAMDRPPFPKEHDLDSQLQVDRSRTPLALWCADRTCSTLPGQPRVQLTPNDLDTHLAKELSTPDLDELAPRLWLV